MVPFFISHPIYWLLNWQLIRFIIFLNTIKSMIKPEPYFHKLVPPKERIDGIDDVIINVVGIHYFEEDNVGTCYWVIWSKRRNVAILEPAQNLINIRDGLLLWKCYVLTFLYSCSLEPLYLHQEQQLNNGYVWAMIICDRCARPIYHILLGWILLSMSMITAPGRSYKRYTACACSPRSMEDATITLSAGKHLMKIHTAG